MPHKTLHDRESITLGILTFGEFLTEPLDCNVAMRKSSQTLDLIFHVCRVENATFVVKHQSECLITLLKALTQHCILIPIKQVFPVIHYSAQFLHISMVLLPTAL